MAYKVEICASYSLAMLHEQVSTCIDQQQGWEVVSATTTVLERTYQQMRRKQLYYTTTLLFKRIK